MRWREHNQGVRSPDTYWCNAGLRASFAGAAALDLARFVAEHCLVLAGIGAMEPPVALWVERALEATLIASRPADTLCNSLRTVDFVACMQREVKGTCEAGGGAWEAGWWLEAGIPTPA